MENIYKILKDFGLEVPEDKKADFDKAWKENYRTKTEYEKATSQRDEYKSSLDTVSGKLKEFEGVDVADLKGQIETLKNDLKKKDDEYAAKEAERTFNDTLDKAIASAGGRNPKAIRGLLDLESLKKDQKIRQKTSRKRWMLSRSRMLTSSDLMNRFLMLLALPTIKAEKAAAWEAWRRSEQQWDFRRRRKENN